MARVLALVPDLLFGSRLQAAVRRDGYELELIADEPGLRVRLGEEGAGRVAALVIDLTDDGLDGPGVLERLVADGTLGGIGTLGFYSHVDASARRRAESAGFDLVVPRSRMAREAAALVERVAAGAGEA
ncbi:MAG TPA: hypothetical protein VKG62_07905 [Solirubrobacteraceae bacterium]|nr:hypothetical protein [Solirubrobacteraceae bacterium]